MPGGRVVVDHQRHGQDEHERDPLDRAAQWRTLREAAAEKVLQGVTTVAEMVRVTKPGGRVAIIARSMDMPSFVNLPLSTGLKAKVEAPGMLGMVSPQGCADASLYPRMRRAGLTGGGEIVVGAFDRHEGGAVQGAEIDPPPMDDAVRFVWHGSARSGEVNDGIYHDQCHMDTQRWPW